jgi:magnesium chelatase family protein
MNPCPCGYYGDLVRVHMLIGHMGKHQKWLSGPLLDRIDINLEVRHAKYAELVGGIRVEQI